MRPCELQRLAFNKHNKRQLAPNVLRLVAHFNRMSRWVCAAVVRKPQLLILALTLNQAPTLR